MNRTAKRLSAVLLSASLAVSLAACGDDKEDAAATASPGASAGAAPKPATLKVMMFNDKPADLDKVLAEFEKRSKDTLNTKLEFEFNSSADHKQKLGLKMAAGEEVDLAFDAGFMTLSQNISNGFYQELDKYFNNDEYPGLKKAFSKELIEANKTNGKLYVIPLTQFFYDVDCIFIRKDLREKYGLAPIQSYDDFKVYLDKVKENDKTLVPLALRGDRGFYKLFENEAKQTNFRTGIAGVGAPMNVVLSDDGKKVLNAVAFGDPQSLYDGFTAPLNKQHYFEQPYDKYVEFSKYLEKDVMVQKDAQGLFVAGKAAAGEGPISTFSNLKQKLQSAVPGSDLEMFVYNSKVREMQPGAIGVTYKANNNLVIPVTSKNADRTMKFLDWLYSSSDNHDLFDLGIEGVHWNKDGDKGYKPTDSFKNYNFPNYQLTLNPVMSRINTNNDPEVLKYMDYSAKEDTYYRVPLASFIFNSEPVKTEVAKVTPKHNEYYPIMKNGLDANWKTTMEKENKDLTALGMEKIRAELVKQVQEYLDKGGK
jgi:putative aldouronate transport system substrate-binding protein